MSMARTCSKCGNKGHNSRTCWSTTQYYWTQQLDKPKERRSGTSSLRLFGVQLDHHDLSSSSSSSSVSVISRNVIKRKRRIMDYCNSWSSSSPHLTSCLSGYRANIGINRHDQISRINNGGLQETNYNKGVGWSEEEHRKFLEGIETLGKGDWRGISKHYVTTRSPTQVASHAQKYLLRLQNSTTANTATINNLDFNFDPHKKRCRVRPSLFDVSKDQLVSPRQLIDINTDNPNTEASVNNPYECWPAVHYSTPLRIDVNLNNSSSQVAAAAAAAAGGGLDLELKLAVSIMPLGLDQ